MQQDLKNKSVVITGASSGVGRMAALTFAERGASIVLAARNEAALQQVADECKSLGGQVLMIPTDVSDAEAVHRQVILTNLVGYMNGAHAVLPIFKRQSFGILINNISIGGFLPVPYGAGYTAAKFGLRGFSDSLKGELRGRPTLRHAQ